MKQGIGFNREILSKKEDSPDKWVVIYSQGLNNTFLGRVKSELGSYAILNPSVITDYIMRAGKIFPEKTWTFEDARVPIVNAAVEPTTKESLENYILYENERTIKRLKSEEDLILNESHNSPKP
jgi:hypothetical protein